MTRMACPSVLLLCVVFGLFTTVHSQPQPKPFEDTFEIATNVVIPCGSRCVVQSYPEVLEATNKCVMSNTGLMMEVEQYLKDNNLNTDDVGNGPTYQQIYDAMFSEGRSPLCRWYRKYGGCYETEFGRICGRGIMQALTNIMQNFDMLICSQNPNYLACVSHPSLLGIDSPNQPNTSPYAICATSLANNFVNINYENYYNDVILRENGEFLFSALRAFGKCIGDAVKTVTADSPPRTGPTGCNVVGEHIKKYINDALDYFHFGQGGKDYLKCFNKRALHMNLTECGKGFETDLKAILGDNYLTQLNTTLFNGGYRILQGPYSTLSTCFKRALDQNCGAEPDSVALVNRILHPLDHLFGVRSDNPAFCSGSGPVTPTPPTPRPVTKLKPLKDAFEIATNVVIPCGSRCVVQRYRDVLRAANTCIMSNAGIQMEVDQYLRDNNLHGNPTYQQIYDAMFSEGQSPLCRWYRRYGGCFENEFGQVCGRGVREALTGLVEDFDMLVCSRNPNYVACAAHPSLIMSGSGPYIMCAQSLITAFQNINYDNFYEELIISDRGRKLFNTLGNFGDCIGEAVKTVPVSPPTGCTAAGEDIKKYVNDALDYFHFGQGGKDYVKCFSNRDLHMDFERCGMAFATDLQMKFGDEFWVELNTTLFIGGYSALQQPYRKLSTCFKRALDQNCRMETDSVALVDRCLHPLDHLFGLRNDDAAYCTGNGAMTSVVSLGLILSGLFILLGIILRLH